MPTTAGLPEIVHRVVATNQSIGTTATDFTLNHGLGWTPTAVFWVVRNPAGGATVSGAVKSVDTANVVVTLAASATITGATIEVYLG